MLVMPPPPARLADLPLVGDKLSETWVLILTDVPSAVAKYGGKLSRPAAWLASFAARLAVDELSFVLSFAIAAVLLASVAVPAALAKEPLPPGITGGGSLPLADVLDVVKPYPNLVVQVRLQLVRANVSRDKVVCSGRRLGNDWPVLGGARVAPYECPIGKRTLMITATQTYFDRNGHKLRTSDPELPRKAAKVKESGVTWRWK